MNSAALRNTLGGSTVKVDPVIRSKLRSRILQVVSEFPDKNPADLFQEIMAVVGSLMTKGSGSTTSSGDMYKKLNQPSVNRQAQNQ